VNLRSFSTLQLALGASIAVHAGLLSLKIVDSDGFERIFDDAALDVVLVNARTNDRPDKATAIAQASMAGGGDGEQGRSSTPLPPSARVELGDKLEEQARSSVQNLQAQQLLLLAHVRTQLAALPAVDSGISALSPDRIERDEQRRNLSQQLAEIERRIQRENARPKKRYLSPATREEVYAVYYDGLRRAIEIKGTGNFPQLGGKKLYGELTMAVTVSAAGRVLATEVVAGSGDPVLDRRAEGIARAAGPFAPFNDAMRRQADQIVMVSRFKFTRDDRLEAHSGPR